MLPAIAVPRNASLALKQSPPVSYVRLDSIITLPISPALCTAPTISCPKTSVRVETTNAHKLARLALTLIIQPSTVFPAPRLAKPAIVQVLAQCATLDIITTLLSAILPARLWHHML